MRIRDEYLHGSDLTGVVKKIEVTTGTGNNANKSVIKYIKADSEGGVVEVPIGDITGKAATASKLDNTSAIGSKTNPVYFTANGVPSACTYSLNATVPVGAANKVLYYSASNTLDTQSYTTLTSNLDVFTVATASAAGKKGLVPAPSANQLGTGNFFLRADGVWTVIENKTAALNGTATSLVTTGEKYNWNSAYNWYNSMTSGDTDGIINKWKEVEAFLANYGDSSTLAAELAKLVTLSTDQTITGIKTFSEVINGSITGNADTVDGYHESAFFRRRNEITSNSNADDISLLGGFLNATGNGSGNSNYPENYSDFFNFPINYHTQFSCRSNFYWRTLKGNPAGTAWRTLLDSYNYTNYTVQKDGTGASGTWGIDISGNATTADSADTLEGYHASDFATSKHTHSYLPLSGGTLTGNLTVTNSYIKAGGNGLQYPIRITRAYNDSVDFLIGSASNVAGSSEALTMRISNNSSGGSSEVYIDLRNGELGVNIYPSLTVNGHDVITSNNIGSLSVNYANSAGNADTATKLQTARTIWGNSFDGTGNVSGGLTDVTNIFGSGSIYINSDRWHSIEITRDGLGKSNIGGIDGRGVYFAHETDSGASYMYLKYGVGLTVNSNVTSNGFKKEGSSDSYVLLGGGGHKAVSDFATASALNNYVTLNTEQTITGIKTFASNTFVLAGIELSDIKHASQKTDNWGGYGGKNTTPNYTGMYNSLDFYWYDDIWSIGNLRSSGSTTNGFGIGLKKTDSNNNLYFAPAFRITETESYINNNKVWHTGNLTKVSQLTNDAGYITASNAKFGDYLPLSGGTMTGQIVGNNVGGGLIYGRRYAALYQKRNNENDWHPVVGFKTKTGSWEFGSAGTNDLASFSWGSDSDFNSGNNSTTVVNLRPIGGTIALTSDIPTSLPANGGNADTATSFFYNNNFDTNYGNYAIFQQYTEISDFPHNGWFNSIKMLHDNNMGYFTEIATSFTGEDGMWRRTLCHGVQYGWYKMLDSGNFNSYTPKLDGTGASGTWGINITGNAASASNVDWGGVTNRPTNVSAFTNDAGYLTSHAYSYGSIDIYDVNGTKKTSNNTVSASVNTETLRLQEGANIAITAINSGDPGSDVIKIAVTGIESNINQNGYGQLALWKNGASSVSATLQSATFNDTLIVKAGSGIDFSGVNGTANNDIWTISAIPYNCAITLNNNSAKSLIKDSWSDDGLSVYLTSSGTSGGTSLAAGTYALWIEDRSTDSGTPNYYSGTFTCAGSAAAGRLDEIALHSSMATIADTNAPTRIFVATLISSDSSNTPGKHVLRFCSLDSKATPHYLTVKVNRII